MLLVIVVLFGLIKGLSVSSGSRLAVSEPKSSIGQQDLIQQSEAGSSKVNAVKTIVGGNRIVHLCGSPFEMGYQHGNLLSEEIQRGVVPIFADPVSGIQSLKNKPGWLKNLILKFLEIKLYRPIERNTPREYLEEIKGIADGAGLPYKTVFIANFLSDLNMSMLSGQIKSKSRFLENSGGCTSFAVSGAGTEDGELVFGRNTDYVGQGRWSENQTLFHFKPARGFQYVKVSTAGMLKCNSCMNEKGIVVGGHFMGYKEARPHGHSFTILENEIMRKADSLDDAIDIVRKSSRGGSFGLLIADGKTGEAVALEASPKNLGVRKMDNHHLAVTNFALTDELKQEDLLPVYNIMTRNVIGRYQRITRLIKEHMGTIDVGKAASFLGDRLDAISETERGTGATIGFESNVTSVVFKPGTRQLWVATGSEPACDNPYIGFELDEGFNRIFLHPDKKQLPGYQWHDIRKKEAIHLYVQSRILLREYPHDLNQALDYVEKAMALDPHESFYARIAGKILIHQRRFQEAIQQLETAEANATCSNEKAIALLLRGQAHDLLMEREAALSCYQAVADLSEKTKNDNLLNGVNRLVVNQSLRFSRNPFKRKQVDLIGFVDELQE